MSKRLGLVIGNSVYRDNTLAKLATPDADVGDLADVLLDQEVGQFDDVKVVVNVSAATARRAISDFFSGKSRDDLLLLYFSCHGVLDENGRLYLALKDTERQLLRATSIPAAYITDEMNASRSQRQILILDCCHSGAFARGAKGVVGATVGTAAAFEGTGYGRVVLTATDATQYAWEDDQAIGEAANSLFTRYLVEGLRSGEADADKDGRITADELYDYIFPRVIKKSPKQTPGKWSYKEQGEIVIAYNPRPLSTSEPARPAIELDDEVEGRLRRLYTRGLSAYWLEEWDKAESAFQAISDIQPDYQDTASKLSEVKRQKRLSDLYQRALAASEKRDWNGVITALEILKGEVASAAGSAGYKDTEARLAEAKKQKSLAGLYSQAQQLFEAKQWQAVVKVFENIASIEKEYPDPAGLLAQAQRELEALNRQKELEERYNRALKEMEAGDWQEARAYLLQVQESEPGYGEAGRLLARVEAELARAQPATPVQPEPSGVVEAGQEGLPETQPAEAARSTRIAKAIASPLGWVRGLKAPRNLSQTEKQPASARPIFAGWSAGATRVRKRTQEGTGAEEGTERVVQQEIEAHPRPAAVTGEITLLPERAMGSILMVAAGWFLSSFINFWGDQSDAAGTVRLVMIGGLAGLILWLALRRLPLPLNWKQGLLLIAGWMLAPVLAILVLVLRNSGEPIDFLLSFTLGGALGGLAVGWVIRQVRPSLSIMQFLGIVAGCAIGFGVGGVIMQVLEPSLKEHYGEIQGEVFTVGLGIGLAGLLVASTVINRLASPGSFKIRWSTILAGAAGFTLSELIADRIVTAPGLYGQEIYLHLIILAALGAAILGLPSRKPGFMLFLSALGVVGLLVGHLIGIKLAEGHDLFLALCWGAGAGLALGVSTRSLPGALILGLFGMAGMTAVLVQIVLLSDHTPGPLAFPLAWGVLGAALAVGWSFLGQGDRGTGGQGEGR